MVVRLFPFLESMLIRKMVMSPYLISTKLWKFQIYRYWKSGRILERRDWKVYYTYFNKAQQDTFYVDPFLTDGRPEDVKITKTSAFPDAMICKYKDPKAANPEDAGFLFIKAPPVTVPDGAKTWNVGIDFGTSSTTVYRTELPDGGPSAPVTLRDRLLQITDSGDLRSLVQDDFLSNRDEETPLFSLFQENSIGIPPDDSIKPLLDGRIYFVDDPTLPENVISNLKWSDDPVDRKRTQAYLEQICLQSAAEAAADGVRKINWRFSYPIAFSAGDRADFEITCTAAANDVSETGFQTEGVNLETESVVTGRFFGGEFGRFCCWCSVHRHRWRDFGYLNLAKRYVMLANINQVCR